MMVKVHWWGGPVDGTTMEFDSGPPPVVCYMLPQKRSWVEEATEAAYAATPVPVWEAPVRRSTNGRFYAVWYEGKLV